MINTAQIHRLRVGALDVGNLYKEVKCPNLIAKISGHVENFHAFNRYRDIDEEMAKETIMKLE